MLRPRACARRASVLAATLLLVACGSAADAPSATPATAVVDAQAAAGHTITVHRTATCACCGDYEDYLEAAGFTVEPRIHEDLASVKARFGIPDGEGSCHTGEVAGYAAEGHIPVEALLELLEQAPEIDGIGLAGMPAGSPGMPGEQEGPFVVRTFVDGEVDGELGRY